MTESRRAAVRIAANYARLGATVVIGLTFVNVLLRAVGEEVFGLVSLLTSTIGIVAVVEEAASWSMIRELGAAHHSGDPREFKRVFNSAVLVSAAAAAMMLALFGLMMLALPLLKIAPELLPSARWYVMAMAIMSSLMVLLSPQFNMYLVLERMVGYNIWLVVRRGTALAGALSLIWLNADGDPAHGLFVFGWVYCLLQCGSLLVAVAIMTIVDRRLIPSPAAADRAGIRLIIGVGGWNLGVLASQVLALPAGAVIMNLAFGLVNGNMVFGLAVTLGGYARMFASGMTAGLDAVAARLSASSDLETLRRLNQRSTELHGLAAFPAAFAVAALAWPLLHVWVGSSATQPETTLPLAATITRVLLIGLCVLCIGDGWTRTLYGAGMIRRYAPMLIASNVLTPVLAVILLTLLPTDVSFTGPAWAFSITYFVAQMIVLPRVVAKWLGLGWSDLYEPLTRLAVAATAALPVLLAFYWRVDAWNLIWLMAAVSSYAAAYLAIVWLWVLRSADRQRWRGAMLRLSGMETVQDRGEGAGTGTFQ